MERIAETLRTSVQQVKQAVPVVERKTAVKYGLSGFIATGFVGAVWNGGIFGMWALVACCSICYLVGSWSK